jgi:5-methylcytosine-specific restriction protein A
VARTHGHGNSKWTRDETILALDLYFECEGRIPSPRDERVHALSALLRRYPRRKTVSRVDSFRNPAGVAFKLQNLRQVATGRGLTNVSRMDRTVWREFGANRVEVQRAADLIRRGVNLWGRSDDAPDQEDGDDDFFEGRIVTALHSRKERDPRVRQMLLNTRTAAGLLTCEICQCRPSHLDPTYADAIFEAHHLVPFAMTTERRTQLDDLALLCANCHRLIHRAILNTRRWLTVDQARRTLALQDA